MSYYNDSRRPSYYSSSSSRLQPGYGSSYGYQPSSSYEPPQGYNSGYERRGRSERRPSYADRRSVSPLGSSKYERPYEVPRRNPSIRRGASREPLSGYEPPPYSRDESSLDSAYGNVQARVGVSSFYSRDPCDRPRPPPRGYSQRQEPPRPDPISSRSSHRPSGPYGVDISSMAGGYDVSGLYSGSSSSSRRPSDGPDFSRGSGFGYGYDPGLDGIEPPSRRYPPSTLGNSYGGGTSSFYGGSCSRRPSRGYYY